MRPKRMDAFLIASIASKEMRVPRKKLVKRPNREKRAKKLKKGVAKRAGVWYYTWAPSAETKEWLLKPQLRSERKEPIDAEKFRFVLRNLKRSKFKTFEMLRKKCLTKNHFCGKIIKSSAAKAEVHRTLKIEQYRKTCNGTYFRVGKTRKTIPNKVIHTGRKRLRAERNDLTLFKW